MLLPIGSYLAVEEPNAKDYIVMSPQPTCNL